MAEEKVLVNIKPGRVFVYGSGEWMGVYMYLEGHIAFGNGTMTTYNEGVAIVVKPAMVLGKPGVSLIMAGGLKDVRVNKQINAKQLEMPLPGGRVLLINSPKQGKADFFIGPKGGYGVQQHVYLWEQVQMYVPKHALSNSMTIA